jgi:hypothetical protein
MFEELLEGVRATADLSAAVDENLRRLIVAARKAGASNADLAKASGLSHRAVAAMTLADTKGRGLDLAEVEVVLQGERTVAVVAAGWVGYREYRAFNAYICQANRHFDPITERFGFYSDREVKPEFPKIVDHARAVAFNAETAAALRADGHEALANVIDKVIALGARDATTPHDVYALSAPDARETLLLPAAIMHTTRGPGSGFVQKQRYVSEHALKQHPKTTRELLALER